MRVLPLESYDRELSKDVQDRQWLEGNALRKSSVDISVDISVASVDICSYFAMSTLVITHSVSHKSP